LPLVSIGIAVQFMRTSNPTDTQTDSQKLSNSFDAHFRDSAPKLF